MSDKPPMTFEEALHLHASRTKWKIVDNMDFEAGWIACAAAHAAERERLNKLPPMWRDKAKYIAIGNSVGAGCLVQAADELEAALAGKE